MLKLNELEQRITDTLQRIVDANVGITDTGYSSVVRTLVSAIINELDIQEYNIQYIYDCLCIDSATGDELDKLVEFIGVYRHKASSAVGDITFKTSEPAKSEIIIPKDTIVSTRSTNATSPIEFRLTNSYIIGIGQSQIIAKAEAVVPGVMAIPPRGVCIMNTPIIGITEVFNASAISGGTDMESDESVRLRAKSARNAVGKATETAMISAIKDVDGVLNVDIDDMAQGVGTCDVYISCTSMPPTETIMNDVNTAIKNTKSVGIKVNVVYPTIVSTNVTATVTYANGVKLDNEIANEIVKYFNSLSIGDKFIKSKLICSIMDISSDIEDISISEPVGNITPERGKLLRAGTITINGEVVTVG